MGIAAAAFLLWSAGGWWVAVCAAIYFVVPRILAIQRAEAGVAAAGTLRRAGRR